MELQVERLPMNPSKHCPIVFRNTHPIPFLDVLVLAAPSMFNLIRPIGGGCHLTYICVRGYRCAFC